MTKWPLSNLIIVVFLTNFGVGAQALDSRSKKSVPSGTALEVGGVVTGGGSSLTMKGGDPRPRLADFFYEEPPTSKVQEWDEVTYFDLPADVQEYMEKVIGFLNQMGVSQTARFFDKVVKTKQRAYLLVPDERIQTVPCRLALPKVRGKVKSHSQYACTFRGATYLLKSEWEPLPIMQKTLGLVHERLWAAFPEVQQRQIAGFVGVLEAFMLQYEAQLKGERPAVTKEMVEALPRFYQVAAAFEFLSKRGLGALIAENKFKVVDGGGMAFGCPDNLILRNSVISAGTRVVVECGKGTLEISDSTVLSSFIRITIPGSFAIKRSRLQEADVRNTSAKDSTVTNSFVRESLIEGSTIEANADIGPATIKNSKISNSRTSENQSARRASVLTAESSNLINSEVFADTSLLYTDVLSSKLYSPAQLQGSAQSRKRIESTELRDR